MTTSIHPRSLFTPEVPKWVTVFAALMASTGIIVGLVALIDPALFPFTEADEALGRRWAGRNLGLAMVTAAAVAFRSRAGYVIALLAGASRELGDLAAALTDGDSVVPAAAVLAIGLVALIAIWRTPARVAPHEPSRTD